MQITDPPKGFSDQVVEAAEPRGSSLHPSKEEATSGSKSIQISSYQYPVPQNIDNEEKKLL